MDKNNVAPIDWVITYIPVEEMILHPTLLVENKVNLKLTLAHERRYCSDGVPRCLVVPAEEGKTFLSPQGSLVFSVLPHSFLNLCSQPLLPLFTLSLFSSPSTYNSVDKCKRGEKSRS